MRRPAPDECNAYFHTYIDLFRGNDLLADFESQPASLVRLLGDLPEGEDSKLHTPYTWTLKQVVGHLMDTERVFATRFLRIASGDSTPNPGFEQNDFVANFDYESVSIDRLLKEFSALRASNAMLVRRCREDQLSRSGMASGNRLTARAAFFVMGGHVVYHAQIMEQRLSGVEK